MNKELWNDLNTLLTLLRETEAVKMVDQYFRKYGNEAPGFLLREQIAIVQKHLEKPMSFSKCPFIYDIDPDGEGSLGCILENGHSGDHKSSMCPNVNVRQEHWRLRT